MLIDEGLELLTDDEAFALLAQGDVGRVGITIGALPAIFPVNYRFVEGVIVFRTSPGSKLSAAMREAVVAFEVDDFQALDRTGWSVLAVGRSQIVFDDALVRQAELAGLEPYADGRRVHVVRIEPTFVTGRRIVHGANSLTTRGGLDEAPGRGLDPDPQSHRGSARTVRV